jgi:hypothetical protein
MVRPERFELPAVHNPMVIVDEAHNVRTPLSFDALRRISPSCIVELTATPDKSPRTGSNILYSVTASELKTDQMIKLPIHLVHPSGVPRSSYLRQALRETKIRRSTFTPPHHAALAALCGLVLLRRSHPVTGRGSRGRSATLARMPSRDCFRALTVPWASP